MKEKGKIVFAALLVVALLVGFAGCADQGSSSTSTENSSTSLSHAPALQPASHVGRFEELGANGCYGCHGNGELANPSLTQAPVTPQDHYLDMSYDSHAYDPGRNQCITCHPAVEQ